MNIQLTQPLSNSYGDRYFEEINHQAFAKLSADDVLFPYFSSCLEAEDSLFFIIGTDSGLLKQFIENRAKHKFTKFVFIEFDEVIERLDLQVDSLESLTDKSKNVWLFNQDFDIFEFNQAFASYMLREEIHLIKSLCVMDAGDQSAYEQLWNKFEVDYKNYLFTNFDAQNIKKFEQQRFLNAADNLIPASILEKSLVGKDAIIIGGGPTLDDAIEWIKTHQNKFIIFAAARVSNRLKNEGILVDFLITIDPFSWSFDNSKGIYAHSEHSILVNCYHAQHRLVSQWTGLSCFLGQRFGFGDAGEDLNIDNKGPTVTNSALHVAVSMGAKRVFLAGIDFCFAKGQTHESGSNEAKLSNTMAYSDKEVLEDNAGQMTESRADFYAAKVAMETEIQTYIKSNTIEFISLGLYSAKMENVVYQSMESIELEAESKRATMEKIRIQLMLDSQEKRSLVEETLTYLKKQKKRFAKLNEFSQQGLTVNKKLCDKNHNLVEKQAQKIEKLRSKAIRLIGQDWDHLVRYKASFFSDAFKPIENNENLTIEEIQKHFFAFFNGFSQVSKAYLEDINVGIDRCTLKFEEFAPKTLPCSLIKGWQRWSEPGRVFHWINTHPAVSLNEQQQACVDEAIEVFERELGDTQHAHFQILEEALNDVSKILARANRAFEKKSVQELEKVVQFVEPLESESESQKQDLLAFLQGMKLELQERPVEAFNTYEPIKSEILRHLALKKMLPIAIALEDYSIALEVLQHLMSISLEYMVPYADMLKALGNTQGAIEVLNMYLNQHPEKYLVKNKLASLLIETNQTESALELLEQVLNIDSENKAALLMQQQISANSAS
ncbi:6-hydroxymethylpterin diphosphokinase MptE-like protein [Thiomicrorhabdus indica]|uniref:6-hydroxymethylpterin diphosphokinase MptE-like protein n=1 Tax=Thiomicrorhabdus indica TaxID=2267253 RepID=UPI002AA84A0C|nr:6-hydroxymethylpterin diphosphokinase MptE-like protein [Thiomicrorhabdus indica]